ncbi:MAG: beta-propeller fold lactonase family protein [Nitrospirae bacterium]|nr:beta-propeller fold lactonase family protein [Candidatus Manganitrophaceae bacterium]
MKPIRWTAFVFFLLSIGTLQGCGGSGGGGGDRLNGPNAAAQGDGNLYVVNGGTGSVSAFDSAVTADGDLSPSRHFPETLAGPTGLFLDPTTDTLYVANTGQNAVLIFEHASTLRPPVGLTSPTRMISGPQTRLQRPSALFYDTVQQRLYVANEGDSSVVVFHASCATSALLNGNIPPCKVIAGPSTAIHSPKALALDTGKDILYLSNTQADNLLAYDQATSRGGAPADCVKTPNPCDTPPSRVITSAATPAGALRRPFGLTLDSANDRLYAVNAGGDSPAIFIYDAASTQSGETAPDRILTGTATLLGAPTAADIDPVQNRIFVINNNHAGSGASAVIVFSNIEGRCTDTLCNLAPDRVITGDQTGFSDPNGLAFDSQLERIYVANSTASTISLFGMEGNISPTKIDAGINTKLEQPISFFYDSDLDRLYVANYSFRFASASPPITVYDQVSSAPLANTPPSWGLADPSLRFPRAVYVDKARNLLLVLESFSYELRVYPLPNLSTAPVGTNVTITALASFTIGLNRPTAITVDPAKGEVYVANEGNQSIVVYNFNSCTATVCASSAPTRTITGAATKLLSPFGLFIDTARDILYVTNITGQTVIAFSNASSRSGNTPPDRVLSSLTLTTADALSTPTAPFMNVAKDRLFLINRGNDSIYVYDRVSTLNGEVAPSRKLSGPNTQLDFTQGNDVAITGALWVDTTRGGERIFVGEPKDPGCTLPPNQCARGALLLFSAEGNITPSQVWSGGEQRLIGPVAIAIDTKRDLLYVANQGDPASTADDSIELFTQASQAEGTLPLTGTLALTGGTAEVTGTGTAFTTELEPGDRIKIGSSSAVVSAITSDTSLTLVAPYTGTTASNQVASRLPRNICSPAGTSCVSPDTKLNNPGGLAVDSDQNRLYVSNAGTDCSNPATPCNALLVFHTASNLNNDAIPDQVITSTALNSPRGLALDPTRKTLYVANNGSHSILVFRNVEQLKVAVTPDAEIGGAATQINAPIGVAYDAIRDLLYVLNGAGTPEILVFSDASSLAGDIGPSRIISGSFMKVPTSLFLDSVGDLLYVADPTANAVYLFTEANNAEGDAPHRTISGNNTGFNQPLAVAVDTAR